MSPNDTDCQHWLDLLDRVAIRCGWRVFAWVLMTNHFHLYLRTPEPNLSRGMHDLNSGYASAFNRRHRRCGALYQGRFKAVCNEFGIHPSELVARRRRGNDGRLAAIYLCRRLTDESVGVIGNYFGGVSTSAISKAVQRAEIRRSQDRVWERQLKSLMKRIRSSGQSDAKRLP